jgi:hypothetical protein
LTELRSVLRFLGAHGRRHWRGAVPRAGNSLTRPTNPGSTRTSSERIGRTIQPTAADAPGAE